MTNADCTIQYNGNRFDQPFLEERYRKHKMDTPFKEILSLDLYQLLKPCQSLFKLSKMKQPDLENFVGIHNRKYCDGGQCIRLYKTFMKKKDPEAANIVMGHNEEDLLGLGTIFHYLHTKNFMMENIIETMRDFRAGIKDCHRTFCCCSGECILWKFRFLSECKWIRSKNAGTP